MEGVRAAALEGVEGSGGQSKNYYVNLGYVDEISIDTSSLSAENQNGGVWTPLIPKEGGNLFRGSFVVVELDDNLVADNLTPELQRRGLETVNALAKVWDYNISLGGPIAKDRLWFFSSFRYWGSTNTIAGLYYNDTPEEWFYTPDRTRQAITTVDDKSMMARMTWQATPKNKFNLFYDYQPHCTCHRNFSSTTSRRRRSIPAIPIM